MKAGKKLENLAHRCFDGELTMPKINFWLIGAVCLLAGIVYGMRVAPMTHGMMIGCNNGNNSGNGHCGEACDKPPAEEDAK